MAATNLPDVNADAVTDLSWRVGGGTIEAGVLDATRGASNLAECRCIGMRDGAVRRTLM